MLKGYILEEVLAYLIRTTGYMLLVDESQDPIELHKGTGGGLEVKGRGSDHQVDVLGQLEWIPAFTFPLRLFVEAKFRQKTTGIEIVRNAVGVLIDINQNNYPNKEQTKFYQKYHYVYALFSTSGFSEKATNMALAHQISLIDLSGREFDNLRNVISEMSEMIANQVTIQENRDGGHPNPHSENLPREKLVSKIRNILRHRLGTWPEGLETTRTNEYERPQFLIDCLQPVIGRAKSYNELFVAMVKGPFMLLLKAENPDDFLNYVNKNPQHKVIIKWNRCIDGGRTWEIIPAECRGSYKLSFRLPKILSSWIFGTNQDIIKRALQTKDIYFSNITIYRRIDGKDHLYRLQYDSETTRRHVEELNRVTQN